MYSTLLKSLKHKSSITHYEMNTLKILAACVKIIIFIIGNSKHLYHDTAIKIKFT